MTSILKNHKLLLIFFTTFIIYLPSLFVFYTNDDFFFLKVSEAHNLADFLNFFSLIKGPDGFGMYRPLTSQVFYFIGKNVFNMNPLGLHIISFLFLFWSIYLVEKLTLVLSKNTKTAITAAFLYAVSATHFGHLYYLATFQELGMTVFVLLSILNYLNGRYISSLIFFILGLMSKETAVITPLLIIATQTFVNLKTNKKFNLKKLLLQLAPFAVILISYFLVRIYIYGFATGDTYVWDFSIIKMANTLAWYGIWSLNIPESLVDFVGPGLKINPNLFLYWGKQYTPIFILFFIQSVILVYALFRYILINHKNLSPLFSNLTFAACWFVVSLLPVLFLPIHKFTFYLTLPLFGTVFFTAYLLNIISMKNLLITPFIIFWSLLSILTLSFTSTTHWITQGEKISNRVFNFTKLNYDSLMETGITFVDTKEDMDLPWSPTEVVKISLSDQNFFKAFFPELQSKVSYSDGDGEKIKSRQFLGY